MGAGRRNCNQSAVLSYDIWATVEPAPDRFSTYLDLGNMTSNVAPMWRVVCPVFDGLAGIHQRKGSDIAPTLTDALRAMYQGRRELEKLNPENGWGDFPNAFRYFARVTRAARDHPGAAFWVNR